MIMRNQFCLNIMNTNLTETDRLELDFTDRVGRLGEVWRRVFLTITIPFKNINE